MTNNINDVPYAGIMSFNHNFVLDERLFALGLAAFLPTKRDKVSSNFQFFVVLY